MVLSLLLIPEPPVVPLLETRTAKRFTTSLQTSSAVVQVQLQIAIMSLVRYNLVNQVLMITEMIKRQLELHRLNTHTESRVQMAALRLVSHAFKYGGHIGTHLIVGGVDVKGP